MGSRELKGLLRVLREADVAAYETTGDGFKVTFHDRSAQVAASAEAAAAVAAAETAALDLPEETWDPRDMLRRVHQKYESVAGRGGKA